MLENREAQLEEGERVRAELEAVHTGAEALLEQREETLTAQLEEGERLRAQLEAAHTEAKRDPITPLHQLHHLPFWPSWKPQNALKRVPQKNCSNLADHENKRNFNATHEKGM